MARALVWGIWAASLAFCALPARAFEDAEIRAIVGNPIEPEAYPGSGGVWMARQKKVEIDGAGNAIVTEHLLARVFDPAWGEKQFSPYRRTYWSSTQLIRVRRARIWRSVDQFEDLPREAVQDAADPTGENVSTYLPLRQLELQFPTVGKGQVVEILFQRSDQVQGGELNVRWIEEVFGAADPVIEQQLIVVAPEALEVQVGKVGPSVPRQVRLRDGFREHFWLTGNLPPVSLNLVESSLSRSPSPRDSVGPEVPIVLFATYLNWTYLSEYYGLRWHGHAGQRDPGMSEKVSQILGGASDPTERVGRIVRFAQDEIRTLAIPTDHLGLRPFDASVIYRARAGGPRDKALLLLSLLNAAGIKASPILIRSRAGVWSSEVACPAQLDRILVRVKMTDGSDLWCDPVEDDSPLPAGEGLYLPTREEPERGLIPFPGRIGKTD